MSRHFDLPTLLIASSNAGKLRECEALLGGSSVALVSAASYAISPPEETGSCFAANAALKAEYYSKATGLPALADDSGLCVEGLGGQPGIYSARWAEEGFPQAIERIKQELGDAPRHAHFSCALCLWWPDGHSEQVEGRINGLLTFPPRGEQGFGYDPIFVPTGYEATFAEMLPEQKNAISHRADAFRQLILRCF
jgi:XTP/dITP diphosphohydrolase